MHCSHRSPQDVVVAAIVEMCWSWVVLEGPPGLLCLKSWGRVRRRSSWTEIVDRGCTRWAASAGRGTTESRAASNIAGELRVSQSGETLVRPLRESSTPERQRPTQTDLHLRDHHRWDVMAASGVSPSQRARRCRLSAVFVTRL